MMPRRVHLAVVRPDVVSLLLRGVKRIETRFYHARRPPLGRIAIGDLIHFKPSGGEPVGMSQVISVQEFTNLTPRRIDRLRQRFGRQIKAPPSYWTIKRRCRYGVLIWLSALEPPTKDLTLPRQHGAWWVVLSELAAEDS